MKLRELRRQKGLTQQACSKYLGIPLRTYQNYEIDESKTTSFKYLYMLQKLEQYGYIDEETGFLTREQIKDVCAKVFQDQDVSFCYLFGSYAKGTAKETSDVDLLVSTSLKGLAFFELIENLREALKKKVDVLNIDQLTNNPVLINDILKEGIKIYG